MRTTNYLSLSALVLGSAIAGCSGSSSTGPTGTGGIAAGNGGSTNVGGSTTTVGGTHAGGAGVGGAGVGGAGVGGAGVGGAGVGGAGVGGAGVGGANVGGTAGTATGGTKATGGTVSTAGGSTSTATGGTVATATGGTVSTAGGSTGTATGGTKANTGGTTGAATGGVTGTGGGTSACTHGANVLSDFETGKGSLYPVTASTTGFWFVYKDAVNCTAAQVPTATTDAATAATLLLAGDTRATACNKYAMHSSITGCGTYSGFGAALNPTIGSPAGKTDNLSAYDGISFWIKAGSGSALGPVDLELQSQECAAPPPAGGGTAKSQVTDLYNCHVRLLNNVTTTWQQMFVPFATSGSRWFPTTNVSSTGTTCTTEFCEAPPLVPANMLALQFSLEQPFNQPPTPFMNYDIWVDDVALFKFTDAPANSGLTPPSQWGASGANAFPANKTFAGCTKPTGADGKLLQDAYVQWKAKYVTTDSPPRVISPEINGGATVSEGIGYGLLIAVYMGDKTLFDGLLAYWKAHPSAQSMLMTWEIPGGSGSATDADEDTAFALIQAGKQWGGTYNADAVTILGQIAANEIDASGYLKPGNSFGGQNETNPSYFAPAFYKIFATVDTANTAKWNALVTNVYTQLNNIAPAGSNGLVPAWCSANCVTRGDTARTYLEADMYQYDSHRTPWRIGLDQCWNSEARAKTYLDKVVGFFAGKAGAPGAASAGISSIGDIYTAAGTPNTDSANNSMSLIGCAGVGAMGSTATNAATFRDRAWQFLLEAHYTSNPTFKVGTSSVKAGYTYYNATVGLLTALTMSGNVYPM